jgi:hypothetical protein
MKDYHVRNTCRLCGKANLREALRLPNTPLANELISPGETNKAQELFPLYLAECKDCRHVQLPVVVNQDRLFRNYKYVSGTNQTFIDHFELYANQTITRWNLSKGDLAVEIGSNDGTALEFYKKKGLQVVGVDPAREIAKIATMKGITTICDYFDENIASNIVSRFGLARLVIANNVFAHIDDLASIVKGVKTLLHPTEGIFRFEVQYMSNLLKDCLFDMIYHEHLSYHTLSPLASFFEAFEMSLIDAEVVSTHGGSIRVSVSAKSESEASESLHRLIREEERIRELYPVKRLMEQLESNKIRLHRILDRFKFIIGYGAPAKLTTLMYTFELDPAKIKYVVDDNPLKQGMMTPGMHIPIKPSTILDNEVLADTGILLFAWNFVDDVSRRFPGFRGRLITPMPIPAVR